MISFFAHFGSRRFETPCLSERKPATSEQRRVRGRCCPFTPSSGAFAFVWPVAEVRGSGTERVGVRRGPELGRSVRCSSGSRLGDREERRREERGEREEREGRERMLTDGGSPAGVWLKPPQTASVFTKHSRGERRLILLSLLCRVVRFLAIVIWSEVKRAAAAGSWRLLVLW
ncbi:hypothetical protein AOLI_G00178380 [Acnodon oligacanthus]